MELYLVKPRFPKDLGAHAHWVAISPGGILGDRPMERGVGRILSEQMVSSEGPHNLNTVT